MNRPQLSSSLKSSVFLRISLVFGLLIILGGLYTFQRSSAPPSASAPGHLIGLTQIVPHPSLDAIHRGIVDTLTAGGISPDQILFENALGNIATATQIGHKFVSQRVRVIVPISTPSAQAALSAAKPAGIPLIYAAISDPVHAKLIPSEGQSGDFITGVSDMSPLDEQLALIKAILPQAKKIGVLYNAGEANSVAMVEKFILFAAKANIQVIRATVTSTNDVSTATASLVGKVDAIYIPNDNTVISALTAVLQVTNPAKLPVFSADPESVARGCLATIAHNQYALGQQTGQMILSFLNGTPISHITPEGGKVLDRIVNVSVARTLNIEIPEPILKTAKRIEEMSS